MGSLVHNACVWAGRVHGKKGRQNHLVEIPVYIANIAARQPEYIKNHLEEKKGYQNVIVKKYPIQKNALIKLDGYPARLRGANEKSITLKNAVQLVLKPEYHETIRNVEKYLEYIDKDESVSKAARFSHTELDKLYDELCFKAENSIYKKRPANQSATLKNGQKTFLAITNLKEKAQVINNIITMFRCDATTTTNLKTIGGSVNAGGMQVNKNTLTSQKVVLVHQSVTGLFVTEEELL